MIDSGWTAGSAVTVRILIAGAVLIVPALVVLRGRWSLVRRNAGLIVAYGLIAVAGCQLAYFNAVDHMQVGVAILIEFTAPRRRHRLDVVPPRPAPQPADGRPARCWRSPG